MSHQQLREDSHMPTKHFLWEARLRASTLKCPTNTWKRDTAPYHWAHETCRQVSLGASGQIHLMTIKEVLQELAFAP